MDQITYPIQKFKAAVSEHTLLAGKYQYINFELISPLTIDFFAGQYVLMTIPGTDAKKSYSIASPPSNNNGIDILVDISPQGDGSLYLASLKPGDEVEFMAPAGQFYVRDTRDQYPSEKLLFIATGSGISSIRSIIQDQLETKADTRPIYLHWGLRYVDEIFWEEDFRQLGLDHKNFTFDITLSHPPESWPLCHGHVTKCLNEHYSDYSNTSFYLCGNQSMIQEISSFLKDKGVAQDKIVFEKFF